jgi:hypothetical protein
MEGEASKRPINGGPETREKQGEGTNKERSHLRNQNMSDKWMYSSWNVIEREKSKFSRVLELLLLPAAMS